MHAEEIFVMVLNATFQYPHGILLFVKKYQRYEFSAFPHFDDQFRCFSCSSVSILSISSRFPYQLRNGETPEMMHCR